MNQKYRALWIEDGALAELAFLAGPIYSDGRYELTIARSASEATEFLIQNEYNAVIIDVRLPPGKDKQWNALYKQAARDKSAAKLGLSLIKCILGAKDAEIKLAKPLEWLTPDKIGVLTVETKSDLLDTLSCLGISTYHQKNANMSERVLLEVIEGICKTGVPH